MAPRMARNQFLITGFFELRSCPSQVHVKSTGHIGLHGSKETVGIRCCGGGGATADHFVSGDVQSSFVYKVCGALAYVVPLGDAGGQG